MSWRGQCPAIAVAAPLWFSACGATVYPPPDVAAPSQVGVLDHGRHSSLILQIPDGMVRYSYGDWQWYALRQTGPIEGTAALFWPSEAALGRKELPGPLSPAAVARAVRVAIEHALYVTEDASDVQLLVGRLDRIYEQNHAERVDNAAYDLVFVPYPEPYSMFHNSNQVVSGWLEQLGCRVERAGPLRHVAAGRALMKRRGSSSANAAPSLCGALDNIPWRHS